MISEQTLSCLLLTLYSAPASPELWPKFLHTSSLESAMDLMEYGIIFLNTGRHVLWMNRSAETLLRRADGLLYRSERLHTSSRIESERLRWLLESCAGTANGKAAGSGGSMLVTRKNARPLAVTVAPLANVQRCSMTGAAAVLFVYDPELRVTPPLDLLMQGYGLTKAEGRWAIPSSMRPQNAASPTIP